MRMRPIRIPYGTQGAHALSESLHFSPFKTVSYSIAFEQYSPDLSSIPDPRYSGVFYTDILLPYTHPQVQKTAKSINYILRNKNCIVFIS
jgi:hypothetical protein